MVKKKLIIKILLIIINILVICLIFGNSLKVAPESSEQSSQVREAIQKVLSAFNITVEISEVPIRKAAHFLEFMLLGMIFCINYTYNDFVKKIVLPVSSVSVLIIASIDETIQLFVKGRSCSFIDVGIDFLGGFCGIILVLFIINLFIKQRKN